MVSFSKLPINHAALLCAAVVLTSCSKDAEKEEKPIEAITVETSVVRRGDIRTWTFAEGIARSSRREYLTFENPGRITWLKNGLREGDTVVEGEALVHQDQRKVKADIRTAEASVVEAQTSAAVAEAELRQMVTDEKLAMTTFQRFSTLLKQESASRQEYDEAEAQSEKSNAAVARAESQLVAAKAQIDAAEARLNQSQIALEETELRAPINGVVARLNVQEGYYMTPTLVRTDSEESFLQTVPMVIIDPSKLEITVDVPPTLRDAIRPGLEVYVQPGGGGMNPDQADGEFSPVDFPVKGEVYSVTPSVSPGKRSVQVKIRTTTGAENLEDGMFTTVWIGSALKKDTIVVPMGVFIYRENKPFVFVADENEMKARLRPVTFGISSLREQEITDGVDPGERLITTGRYQLSDGTPIQLLEKKEGDQ